MNKKIPRQKIKAGYARRAAAFFTALAFALPQTPPLNAQVNPAPLNTGSAAKVMIPGEFGVIKRSGGSVENTPSKQGRSPVIIIEDAHAVRDAQAAIGNILAFLEESRGLSFVGVEGASTRLDARLFNAFPAREILANVLDEYMEAGELSGAVSAAIRIPSAAEYHGVESAALYERNIDAYLSGAARQENLLAKLTSAEERLNRFKKDNYSPELFELDRKNTEWLENQDLMGLLSYLSRSRRVQESGILSSYPKLAALLAYLPSEKEGASADGAQIRELASDLARRLQNGGAEFNRRLQDFETERLEEMEFLRYLRDKAAAEKIPLRLPPELESKLRIFEEVRSASGEQILTELDGLIAGLKEELFTGSAARNADRFSRSLYLLKKLVKFELGRGEWEELLKNAESPAVKNLPPELRELGQNLAPYFSRRQEDAKPYYQFYEAAEKRETAMLERIRKSAKENTAGLTVLIAGGFHTEGVSKLLEEEGVPWMIVTPRIGGLAGSENYRGHMTGVVPWKKYFSPEDGRISVSGAFRKALAERLYAALKEDAGEAGARIVLKKWRGNILAALADRGRLEEAGKYTRVIDDLLLGTLGGGERTALESRWTKLVDDFAGELRRLDKSGKLTPENLFRPFEKPAAAAWTTSMVLSSDTVPESWARGAASYERETPPAAMESAQTGELAASSAAAGITIAKKESGWERLRPLARPEIYRAASLLISGVSGAGAFLPAFVSLPFRSELRRPPEAAEAFEQPELKNLRFTMNLKDIGAYITPEGTLDYRNSLANAIELLPLLKEKGIGRVYLYNGLFEMSVTGRDVHRGRNIERIESELTRESQIAADFAHREAARIANGGAYVWTRDGRAVSYLDSYATKETSVVDPETGRTIRITDDYNPFSILSLLRLNPKLSSSADGPGSEEKTRELLRTFIRKAHELGIKVTLDFIPWLSPDSIDETNYRWTFHTEISEEQNEEFRRRDEEGKKAYMQEIASWDKNWFPVRIREKVEGRGVIERIVRVQHLISDYGNSPNIDQVILNPHLEEVQNYYVEAFSQFVELEADEVRVDLAHYYLNQYIKDHPQHYMGLQTEGKPEPWREIIARVKKIAAAHYKAKGSEGTIEINTEAYNQYVSPLFESGVDRSYHDDFFKVLVDVARGAPASDISAQISHLLGNKGKLTAFLSNYDHFRLEQLGGAKEAAQAILFFLAYAGIDVIWDMNDWLGLSGHLFPMVGGNPDPNNPDHHPFARDKGLQTLTNFERLKAALRDAPADAVRRAFFSKLGGKKETWLQQAANGRQDKFISWAWRTENKEWFILVADMRPWSPEGPGWVHLPRKALSDALNDPEKGSVKFSAEDVLTGQAVDVDPEHHHVSGLQFSPSRQFTVIRVTRSELRAEPEGLRWGRGRAAEFALDQVSYQKPDADKIEPVIEEIRRRVNGLKPRSTRRPLALRVLAHLDRLHQEGKILDFDERRWDEDSFFAAHALQEELRIGRGAYADVKFAAEMLFRLAAQSYAMTAGTPADDLTKAYTDLFGKAAAFTARYEKFARLTDDVFLKDAIDRFGHFSPGSPLFYTEDLFKDWLEWEVSWAERGELDAPHPALSQAGFLVSIMTEKGWHMLPPAGADPEKNIAKNPHQFKAFFEILYPLYAFTSYQVYFITHLRDAKEAAAGLLTNQMKYYYKALDIPGNTPRAGGLPLVTEAEMLRAADENEIFSPQLPAKAEEIMKDEMRKARRADTLLAFDIASQVIQRSIPRVMEEVLKNRWYTPRTLELFPLEAVMPGPLGERPFAEAAVRYEENMTRAFYAPEAWQRAKIAAAPRYSTLGDTQVNLPVPGFTTLSFSGMLESAGTSSGYVWKGHYPHYHYGGGNIPWIGFYRIDPSLTLEKNGIIELVSDGTPYHLLIYSQDALQYNLQKKKRQEIFTVIRDKKAVWSALLRWFHNTGAQSDTNLALNFLTGVRSSLTEKTAEDTYFTPGGTDVVPWASKVLELAAKADFAYWDSVKRVQGSIEKFLDGEQTRDETRLFIWFYALYAHPDGLFAYLAENLKLHPGTQRLTNDSALLILDAIIALNWAGLPTMEDDRLRMSKFLLRELLDFFKIHPDGISVPDEAGLSAFLTQYREETPDRAKFESWLARFAVDRLEKGAIDIDNARLISEAEDFPELEADSPDAYIVQDGGSSYDPERFPSAHLLNPDKWPWPGIPHRTAIWKGTYNDGLAGPWGRVKYVFPDVPDGTPVTVYVRGKAVHFEIKTGSGPKEIAKLTLSEAKSQDFASGPAAAGKPVWKRVFDTAKIDAPPLPPDLQLPGERVKPVLYRAEAGTDGFLLLRGEGKNIPLYFPQIAGNLDRTVFIEYNGSSLAFYDGSGHEQIGILNPSNGVKHYASDSKQIDVRPMPNVEVEGFTPSTLAETSDLYNLASKLEPLMKPATETAGGKGYTKIQITNIDEPNLGTDGSTVIVSRYYLKRAAQAEKDLLEFLKNNDPIYQLRTVIERLLELEKSADIFAPDFKMPEIPEAALPDDTWVNGSADAYAAMRAAAKRAVRRITILGKLDKFRKAHLGELNEWGREEFFRNGLRDLLARNQDEEALNSFFFRAKSVSTTDIRRIVDDELIYKERADKDKRPFDYFTGMGIARSGHFNIVEGKLVFSRSFKKDMTPYIFLRFKDGSVRTFDFAAGDLIDEKEREHRQALADFERERQAVVDAIVVRKGELDFNSFHYGLEALLEEIKHPDETQNIRLKISLLGSLSQLLPNLIQSQHEEINTAVVRLVLDFIVSGGYEHAEERARKLVDTYRGAFSEEPAFYLFFALVESDTAFQLSPEAGREGFSRRFREFFEEVFLPATRIYAEELKYFDLVHAEYYYGEVMKLLTELQENTRQRITLYMEQNAERASRRGVFSLKAGFIETAEKNFGRKLNSPEYYFVNKIFEEEAEAQKQISEEEAASRATYITAYGGVQGIGASAALVEYRGLNQEETDAFILDSGVRLDENLSGPSFPKTLEDFPVPPKAIVITHAHLDHIGWLIPLWRDVLKKSVPVYVTEGTYEIMPAVLGFLAVSDDDAAGVDTAGKASFTQADVEEIMQHVRPLKTNTWYALSPKMKMYFHGPSGHLHGAASVIVSTPDSTSFFSGDVSVHPQGPVPGFVPIEPEIAENLDNAMIETTYGMRERAEEETQEKLVARAAIRAIGEGGRVVIPSFANGRTQRVLLLLLQDFEKLLQAASKDVNKAGGKIKPDLKIYIDGQAAVFTKFYLKAYPEVFEKYRDIIRDHVVIIDHDDFRVRGRMRSEAAEREGNQRTIIIASSGNATYGRSRFWASRVINDPKSAIIFTGYMDPQESGSRILRAVSEKRGYFNFGEDYGVLPLLAKIHDLKVSGHASGPEIITHVLAPSASSLQAVFLGHGAPERLKDVAAWIRRHQPEWNPAILQENERKRGAVLRTNAGLETRREFFESRGAEPLFTARAEMRYAEKAPETVEASLVYPGVLEALARGSYAETFEIGTELVTLVRKEGAESVARNLKAEASGNSYYLTVLAGIDNGNIVQRLYAERSASALAPGLESRAAAWTSRLTAGLEGRVRAYFKANPEGVFNYALAFPTADSEKVRGHILALARALRKLQQDPVFGPRIKASLHVLVTADELRDGDLKDFYKELGRTRIAKAVEISDAARAAVLLNGFMEKNSNGLVYGAEGFPVAASFSQRLVRSRVSEEYALPVALLLAERLAQEPGEITPQLLQRVTGNIAEIVRYDDSGLTITTFAAKLSVLYEVDQLIGSMA